MLNLNCLKGDSNEKASCRITRDGRRLQRRRLRRSWQGQGTTGRRHEGLNHLLRSDSTSVDPAVRMGDALARAHAVVLT